jgi:hypothetical protein
MRVSAAAKFGQGSELSPGRMFCIRPLCHRHPPIFPLPNAHGALLFLHGIKF